MGSVYLFTLDGGDPQRANEWRLAPLRRHRRDLPALHQRVPPRHAPHQHVAGPEPKSRSRPSLNRNRCVQLRPPLHASRENAAVAELGNNRPAPQPCERGTAVLATVTAGTTCELATTQLRRTDYASAMVHCRDRPLLCTRRTSARDTGSRLSMLT